LLYILFGNDDFSLSERLRELKNVWDNEETLKINTTIFEASKLTPAQLIDACNSIPFLGNNRLVVVEGLLGLFERKGDHSPLSRSKVKDWQPLADYIPQLPDSTQLVLIDGKIGRNNSLFKKLTPNSKVIEFSLPRGSRLQQWIHDRAKKCGGSIAPKAAKLLAEIAGENLWLLANELEKLTLYTDGRVIEELDVKNLTSSARETNVFAMVDAIVERRATSAMQFLHQLLDEGMAPPYLLFMITRQLRLMVQAKEIVAERISPTRIPDELGLSPNYPVERLSKQTASYTMQRLVEIYHKLLETDLDIKSGRWKGEMALDLLVAELCL